LDGEARGKVASKAKEIDADLASLPRFRQHYLPIQKAQKLPEGRTTGRETIQLYPFSCG
jgi:hypothetical protein